MRFEVLTEDGISAQARPYAEYRVFAALSQHVEIERVRYARLVLRLAKQKRGCQRVSCTLTVGLEGARPLRIRTMGDHAYAAINRAVDAMGAALVTFSAPATLDKQAVFAKE